MASLAHPRVSEATSSAASAPSRNTCNRFSPHNQPMSLKNAIARCIGKKGTTAVKHRKSVSDAPSHITKKNRTVVTHSTRHFNRIKNRKVWYKNKYKRYTHMAVQKLTSHQPTAYSDTTTSMRRKTIPRDLTNLVQVRAILEDVLVSSLEGSLLPTRSPMGFGERSERNARASCRFVHHKVSTILCSSCSFNKTQKTRQDELNCPGGRKKPSVLSCIAKVK